MDEYAQKFFGTHKQPNWVAVEIARVTDEFLAEAIVRATQPRRCDLIVMASHGGRGVRKLLLGSQTAEVLVDTYIPVHLVR